jgi:DNA modification methylase
MRSGDTVDIEFYNKDAREVFLSPKTVDLFLIHPPYFTMMKDKYGGDPNLQINLTDNEEEFNNDLVLCINNMADALTDDGNIFLILPNYHNALTVIGDIIKDTDLVLFKILVWDFSKTLHYNNKNNWRINFIFQIRKNTNFKYPLKNLDSLVIDQPWIQSDSDLSRYEDIGFVYDSFPHEISDIIISNFSKEGDTVADIFAGTGTTVISALNHNRKAIYNDSSPEQFEIAKTRINDIYFNKNNIDNSDIDLVIDSYPSLGTEEKNEKRKKILKEMFLSLKSFEEEEARKQSAEAMSYTQKMFKDQIPHMMSRVNVMYESLVKSDIL